jgi:hypothetical protein
MIELKNESYAEWRAQIERQWWRDNWPILVLALAVFMVGYVVGQVRGMNFAERSLLACQHHSGFLPQQGSLNGAAGE